MTRERVGAARDRLARLRGGAGGGASPRGHPGAPGLAAREATHPHPALSLAQTLDRDGAVRRTAGYPPRQKAALRACGTPRPAALRASAPSGVARAWSFRLSRPFCFPLRSLHAALDTLRAGWRVLDPAL